MGGQKTIKKNFIMNIILTMSSLIFPLITFPYVSRILLPVGTGKVSFAISVITYFNMFAQLGIPTYGIRACAKIRDDKEKLSKLAQELLFINLIMSLFSYVFLACAIAFIPRLREDKILFIIVSMTIFLSAIGMEWLYKALEQYTYITIRSLIFKFVGLGFMFLLIHKQKDYVIYGGITIFSASASNIFNFINVHKYIDFTHFDNYNLKQHLRPVFIFFAMSCATTIYTNLDTVMLGLMASDVEVGYYNAAVKIKNILVSIVASLGTVLLPRASYYVERGEYNEFLRICKKAMNFTVIVAIPMLVYFTMFAREGILFLSGEAYIDSVIPMQIIMPTLVFIGMTNILGTQMLVPLGKEINVLWSEIFGAVTDLILNAVLIPRYGVIGAALGTLVAEFIVLAVQCLSVGRLSLEIYRQVHWIKITLVTIFSIAIVNGIRGISLNSFIILLNSSCVFFGIYFSLLLFVKEPLVTEIVKQIITKLEEKLR